MTATQVKTRKRNNVISDDDVTIIARDIMDHNTLLYLSESPQTPTQRQVTSMEIKKIECLKLWKMRMKRKATYRTLIVTAEEHNDHYLAAGVNALVKGMYMYMIQIIYTCWERAYTL